jgi:hypothetical protein
VCALVVSRGGGVNHHGGHGGAHGHEVRVGETDGPGAVATGWHESVEGRGQDVHHVGGEDDPAENVLTAKKTSPLVRGAEAERPSSGTSTPVVPDAKMDATATIFSCYASRASSSLFSVTANEMLHLLTKKRPTDFPSPMVPDMVPLPSTAAPRRCWLVKPLPFMQELGEIVGYLSRARE